VQVGAADRERIHPDDGVLRIDDLRIRDVLPGTLARSVVDERLHDRLQVVVGNQSTAPVQSAARPVGRNAGVQGPCRAGTVHLAFFLSRRAGWARSMETGAAMRVGLDTRAGRWVRDEHLR